MSQQIIIITEVANGYTIEHCRPTAGSTVYIADNEAEVAGRLGRLLYEPPEHIKNADLADLQKEADAHEAEAESI